MSEYPSRGDIVEEYEDKIEKLKQQIIDDLKSIDAPLLPYPGDPVDILITKWEGKKDDI